MESTIVIIGGAVAAAGIAGALLFRKSKSASKSQLVEKPIESTSKPVDTLSESFGPQTVFSLRPDLRDDDKEIVNFLFENGGQALESELRKKFLQPRTTMWRAVKRLERQGVIEISKKDLQNLVKLKKELEKEE